MNISVTVKIENEDASPLTAVQIREGLRLAAGALNDPDVIARVIEKGVYRPSARSDADPRTRTSQEPPPVAETRRVAARRPQKTDRMVN